MSAESPTPTSISSAMAGLSQRYRENVIDPAEVERFEALMAQEATATGEADPAVAAANEEVLWKAFYDGLNEWIIRSGIRRTVNNIRELKEIYKD